MGKKKGGKSSGNVSQGIHSNVAQSTRRVMRRAYLDSRDRLINQREAFDRGKRVMVTVANPNTTETNRPFIRITAEQAGWKRRK